MSTQLTEIASINAFQHCQQFTVTFVTRKLLTLFVSLIHSKKFDGLLKKSYIWIIVTHMHTSNSCAVISSDYCRNKKPKWLLLVFYCITSIATRYFCVWIICRACMATNLKTTDLVFMWTLKNFKFLANFCLFCSIAYREIINMRWNLVTNTKVHGFNDSRKKNFFGWF